MHKHSHAYQTVSQLKQKKKTPTTKTLLYVLCVFTKEKDNFIKDGLLELYVDGRVYTDYTEFPSNEKSKI